MKHLLLLLLIVFSMCGRKSTSNILTIPLEIEEGVSKFYYTYYPTSVEKDSVILSQFKGSPDSCHISVIRKFDFQPGQRVFESYLNGNLSRERFLSFIERRNVDTLTLSRTPINHMVYCFVGMTDFYEIVIFDKNHNKDFSDDEVIYFDLKYRTWSQDDFMDSLPVVKLDVEFYHNKLYNRTRLIKPTPFHRYFTRYEYEVDSILELYPLLHEHKVAQIGINQKQYDIIVSNHTVILKYNKKDVLLRFREVGEEFEKPSMKNQV